MPHRHSNDEHQSCSRNQRNHHSDADHSSNDYGREQNNRSHWDRHGDKPNLQWFPGDPETTLPLYTEEQLDLLMMRNAITKNITKQTFCFITILSYVTVSVKNE